MTSGLPTFLILGAPKCGTTFLHTSMSGHPDVFMSPEKEPQFFELDAEYWRGPEFYRNRYFRRWDGERAVGEARVANLMLPYLPERVKQVIPDARLIAILRDPSERVFSHWWMHRTGGVEPRPLAEALQKNAAAIEAGRSFEGSAGVERWRAHLELRGTEMEAPVYLEYGYYTRQIERWWNQFEPEQLRIVFFDDLKRDPERVLRDLFGFIGVDPAACRVARAHRYAALPRAAHPLLALDRRLGLLSRVLPLRARQVVRDLLARSGRVPQLDPVTRRWLVAHYEADIRSLEALTGRDLKAWRTADQEHSSE